MSSVSTTKFRCSSCTDENIVRLEEWENYGSGTEVESTLDQLQEEYTLAECDHDVIVDSVEADISGDYIGVELELRIEFYCPECGDLLHDQESISMVQM